MADLKKSLPWFALVLVAGGGATLLASGRLRFAAGGGAGGATDHAQGAEEPAAADAGRLIDGKVVLDEEAYRGSGIRTEEAARGSVPKILEVNGEVQLADARWVRVTPRIPGVARELMANVCDEVAAGAPLGAIESVDLGEATGAYASALAERALAIRNSERWAALKAAGLEAGTRAPAAVGWVDLDQAIAEHDSAVSEQALSKRIHERAKDLFEKGLKTQGELWAAEQDVTRATIREEASHRRLEVLGVVAENEVARANLRFEAAATKLRVLGLGDAEVEAIRVGGASAATSTYVLRSPIAGIVLERKATVGESLEAKDTVYVVADLSVVWVHAALYPKDVALAHVGMPATIHVHGYPAEEFPGRVIQVGLQADEKTRTVDLRIEVPNASAPCSPKGSALRPGAFVTAEVELSRGGDSVVVPLAAVQVVDGKPVLFVKVAVPKSAAGGGAGMTAFERRAVELGARNAQVVEVLKGLQAGEPVAVENAFLLKSEFERSKLASED